MLMASGLLELFIFVIEAKFVYSMSSDTAIVFNFDWVKLSTRRHVVKSMCTYLYVCCVVITFALHPYFL